MDAGILNRRVIIQQPSAAQDLYGQLVAGYTTLATVWAAVQPLSGRQIFAARQAQSTVSVQVTVRYLATITTAMRILYGTHTYGIDIVIDPEMAHESMILQCTELEA
jgi:SPP1 family predicted phage head-tail adaptor